jgi:hypothetical protein
MSVSKRALLATIASVAMVLSTVAMAQTSGSKSTPAASIGEGEAIMIHPKTHVVHKSNIKVSAAKHTAALAKGAREISGGTVIYKQGGKLYMLQNNANERSSEHFQDQFDIDY